MGRFSPAHTGCWKNPELPGVSYLAVTIAAINGSALSGLEGYGSCLAAFRACCGERLARGEGAVAVTRKTAAAGAAAGTFCFAGRTAFGTALGLIGVTPLLELFLFFYGEGEFFAAIGTAECLVCKTHGWPPLFVFS